VTESETLRRRIRELEREIEETRSNLAEEQAANQALQAGQVDAIVDRSGGGALLLQAAQAALRASEEQLRAMFHLAPVGVAQADPATGRWLAVNPRMCLITGYSEAELLKMRIPEITHAEDRQRDWDLFQGVVKGEAPEYQLEKRYIRKDGSIAWVNVNMVVLRDATGKPTRTVATIEDITERRRAAELLRESEERYRHIVEAASEGICSLDAELRITFANGAFARMLGCMPEELLGTPLERYAFPEEFDEFKRHMDVRRRGVAEQYERRLRRKDGKECWALVSGAPILDADGRFAGSFKMFSDITDRRRLEEQLRQSQKMEAVGRLAGGVAHDFNNLLTVMFGYSDILLQGLEPGPLHEATQEVRRAGERAAALTRQLLAFSRKQTLVPEVLDLGDVVNGLSTMVERLIGEEIKVSVVVSPNLGRVKADRGQLEQVVMNLAVNARDAMPKGGNLIFELQNVELDDADTVTHSEVKPGPYVLLAISDTGTGMDAETQKRIFEPFFTTKEAGKGTGLGLSTVHGIVHQSGGSISVYSEPGQGTTLKVYLPRFAGDAAVRRPVSGARKALPTGTETVLVVEDEAAIRQLTNVILQKAGYTVLLAESPVAAERIAGSHPGPIHLMLTDVVMPGMRGTELAEQLLRQRPDLRVLYMSGYTDNAIAHHGFLDAGKEFLQKPFTPLGLMQKIREVLGRSEP
jgi:PAS domain S-box-containing protein